MLRYNSKVLNRNQYLVLSLRSDSYQDYG